MTMTGLVPAVQRTLASEAAAQLRAAIRNGSMPPGTRLVEREIAERLGVSRIPVREAIERLAEEGLVLKIPHRGTFVYAPSRKEIEEIASLRLVLERFAVERVIAHWQPEHESQLHEIVSRMKRAGSERNCEQISELDTLFHQTLWEIADHSILVEIASSLRSRISRFLYEAISVPMPDAEFAALIAIHVEGHEQMIETLKRADVAAAQEWCAQHILGGESRILTHSTHAAPPDAAGDPL